MTVKIKRVSHPLVLVSKRYIFSRREGRTYRADNVSPSFQVRAHNTPVKKKIDDKQESRYEETTEHLVVIKETGQSPNVHCEPIRFLFPYYLLSTRTNERRWWYLAQRDVREEDTYFFAVHEEFQALSPSSSSSLSAFLMSNSRRQWSFPNWQW